MKKNTETNQPSQIHITWIGWIITYLLLPLNLINALYNMKLLLNPLNNIISSKKPHIRIAENQHFSWSSTVSTCFNHRFSRFKTGNLKGHHRATGLRQHGGGVGESPCSCSAIFVSFTMAREHVRQIKYYIRSVNNLDLTIIQKLTIDL